MAAATPRRISELLGDIMTTPEEAIEVLNRIHKADPGVLTALCRFRTPCNSEVADDPTVQVKVVKEWGGEYCVVGLLGIINGIFGTQSDGKGYIGAYYGTDGEISHFGLTLPARIDR